jgi:hypothetical protein
MKKNQICAFKGVILGGGGGGGGGFFKKKGKYSGEIY